MIDFHIRLFFVDSVDPIDMVILFVSYNSYNGYKWDSYISFISYIMVIIVLLAIIVIFFHSANGILIIQKFIAVSGPGHPKCFICLSSKKMGLTGHQKMGSSVSQPRSSACRGLHLRRAQHSRHGEAALGATGASLCHAQAQDLHSGGARIQDSELDFGKKPW